MKPFQRLSCAFLAAAASCAGPGTDAPSNDAGVLIVLHDFKNGQQLELASESHTSRVAYYSEERKDAARKVQSDEVMSAFVREFEKLGFEEHGKTGRVPSIGTSQVIRWGLEVEKEGETAHWLVGTGSPADEWKSFQECRDSFLELYNITLSYQTVRNANGKQYFGDDGARKP